MKKGLLTLLGLALALGAYSQIAIGQFRSHIPLHRFHSVAAADDYVYAAAENGVMLLDKKTVADDNPNLSSWTKVDGLSDVDVALLSYNQKHNTLIISYKNGNLDFIQDDKLYNVSDIKNKQITGSKEPTHIRILDDRAFIVYSFGVVCINLDSRLIEDSWLLRAEDTVLVARDFTASDSRFYISTDQGLYSISKTHQTPSNFLAWEKEPVGNVEFDHLFYIGGHVYANKNTSDGTSPDIKDTIYALSQGEWMPTALAFDNVMNLTGNENEMAICNQYYVEIVNADFEHVFRATWYKDDNSYPYAKDAVLDGDFVWVADDGYGLIASNRRYFYTKYLTSNGPYAASVKNMCSHNGLLAVVPGAATSFFGKRYQYPSLSWFVNNRWNSNSTEFYHYDPAHLTSDLYNVIINPDNDSEWYISSWGNGLFKCNNQRITAHYNAANSPLDSTSLGETFVSGLGFDKKGNLWMTNSQCNRMLKMLEPNGTWHSYNITSGVITSPLGVAAENLLVDSRGFKWITFPRDDNFNKYHLVVFNENGTYDNTGDDQFQRIDMNVAAKVNSSTVYCIAEDLDGEIWIGTDKGIKVIYYRNEL